ncbi:sigma-70 family RNA polymerase sigma factor [Sinomicrobium sp. M5D2P9]
MSRLVLPDCPDISDLNPYKMTMETFRPLLETYAYNILGSYEDAKDVVQDVLLKQLEKPVENTENPKAYLVRSVINHAINVKKRQHKFRKDYPGNWLPEPVATDRADIFLERQEILLYSLMVLLEKLTPKERGVFILKEAYNYSHGEIAETLDISPDNSRQLFRRSKDKLREEETFPEKDMADSGQLEQLLFAIQNSEMADLEALLHKDIHITSDGGGKVSAAVNVVSGVKNTSKFLLGIFKKFYENVPEVTIAISEVNNRPALFYSLEGKVISCMLPDMKEGKIASIYFVRNPDKLKNLQKINS